jgi:hypothetical protein
MQRRERHRKHRDTTKEMPQLSTNPICGDAYCQVTVMDPAAPVDAVAVNVRAPALGFVTVQLAVVVARQP